nr:MAG TPA: minor capsid protein [Caudoviricetes sp.]
MKTSANRKIKLNDQQLTLDASQVSDLYHKLTLELFDQMVDRLLERGSVSLAENPYIWQLEKMNQMGLLNDANVKLIAEYTGIAEKQLRNVIEGEGYKVYKTTRDQLAETLGVDDLSDDSEIQNNLASYANQALGDVNNLINSTLPESVRSVFQSVIEESVGKVITGVTTPERALNDTIMKWFEKGFYGFTDSQGKRWRADSYARTVIRSTVKRAFREMRTAPAREFDIDTFYFSKKATAREACAPLQHQIVTYGPQREENGITILSLSDHGYGTPAGCLGINCGHDITPFVVGFNELPDLGPDVKDISPSEAIANANAQAKQRALERKIRRSKEFLHVAKRLGDKDLIDKYKSKIRIQQGAMRDYLKDKPFLHRDYAREKYHHNNDAVQKLSKTIDKRSKKEYSEILQNLGNKAPKSYSDFKALKRSEKESLRQDNKVVGYVWSSNKEKLTDKQKQQAVDAYYNFKEHGVRFGGHAISQYIARMRRPNGHLMYNFDSILTAASLPLNYQSEHKGRKAKYYNRLLLIYENNSDEIVTFMKTNKPAKTLTEIK